MRAVLAKIAIDAGVDAFSSWPSFEFAIRPDQFSQIMNVATRVRIRDDERRGDSGHGPRGREAGLSEQYLLGDHDLAWAVQTRVHRVLSPNRCSVVGRRFRREQLIAALPGWAGPTNCLDGIAASQRGSVEETHERNATRNVSIGVALMMKSNPAASLRQTTLLAPLSSEMRPPDPLAHVLPTTRAKVIALGRVRDYRKGDLLFRQGDVHDGIYLIEAGLIKSFYASEDARELTLGFWSAGHYVGAPQLFGGGLHAWSSVAVAQTRCLFLSGPALRELCRHHGDLALALLDTLVHKTQCYCGVLQLLATHSMRVRLARLLAMLAASEPRGLVVIGFSHGELASMIGSTRQWVSQSLARFEREGLLDRLPDGDGSYLVRDERLLRSVV